MGIKLVRQLMNTTTLITFNYKTIFHIQGATRFKIYGMHVILSNQLSLLIVFHPYAVKFVT